MGENRQEMWCSIMKEDCIDGWCPSMSKGKNKKPRKCRFWIKITGKHPQRDEFIDDYDCSFAWLPTLMVEQCRIENSTGAAVESLRNKIVETKNVMIDINNNKQITNQDNKQLKHIDIEKEK